MSAAPLAAHFVADGMMGDWDGGWVMLWGTLMMLFVVAVIAAAVVWAVRNTRPQPSQPSSRPEEILAERYARGEITSEEYRERLDGLR